MEKKICKDRILLSQKASPATEDDKQVIQDLLDTLRANSDRCVGMAANMIGIPKAVIVSQPLKFRLKHHRIRRECRRPVR